MAPRLSRWTATLLAAGLLAAGAAGPAAAVSTDGSPFRIDVDPKTRSYNIGDYAVAATTTGAFAVSWEEATSFQVSFKPQRVYLRRFTTRRTPTGPTITLDLQKRKSPQLVGITMLGNATAFPAVTGLFRLADGTDRVDAFGQAVTMSTGKVAASKQLNNANDGAFGAAMGTLADGRGLFAWQNGSGKEGRQQFLDTKGAKSGTSKSIAQTSASMLLDRVVAFGTGHLLVFSQTTTSKGKTTVRYWGQRYGKTGTKIGSLTALSSAGPDGATLGVVVRSDGKLLVTEWKLNKTSSYDLWGQLYDSALKPSGAAKIMVAKGNAKDYVTLVALSAGRVMLGRTYIGSPSYEGSATLFGSTLSVSGKVYKFATNGRDEFKLTKLGSKVMLTRSAVVESRERLIGQMLSF